MFAGRLGVVCVLEEKVQLRGINTDEKILIIIGKLSIGGAEKVAYDIGHYRDKNKFDCHYIMFDDYI